MIPIINVKTIEENKYLLFDDWLFESNRQLNAHKMVHCFSHLSDLACNHVEYVEIEMANRQPLVWFHIIGFEARDKLKQHPLESYTLCRRCTVNWFLNVAQTMRGNGFNYPWISAIFAQCLTILSISSGRWRLFKPIERPGYLFANC